MDEQRTRRLFQDLRPGDRVEVEHEVKVGQKTWLARTTGVVEEKDRRRHGLHNQRNFDDRVWSDLLVLRRDDGELTTVAIDEFTQLKKL